MLDYVLILSLTLLVVYIPLSKALKVRRAQTGDELRRPEPVRRSPKA